MPAMQVITFDVPVTIRMIKGEMFRRDEGKKGVEKRNTQSHGEEKDKRKENEKQRQRRREISYLKKSM